MLQHIRLTVTNHQKTLARLFDGAVFTRNLLHLGLFVRYDFLDVFLADAIEQCVEVGVVGAGS